MLSGISPGRAEAMIVCNWSRKKQMVRHMEKKREKEMVYYYVP